MKQTSQLAALGLFDTRVPRYTSYPTAPHFSATIGADDFRKWTSELPENAEISLYIHVPFCRRLCWFCACRTQGTQKPEPVRAYVQTLLREIAMLAGALPRGVRLSRLHWGGGTPTLLPADEIRLLAGAILERIPLAENAEFSIEIDPNEIDEDRLDALVEAGINRASIGIQDFDPAIQKAIGREQSFEITARAFDMIRARGVPSINSDILFGLPGQSAEKISESVQKLLSLSPDRVALYGYAHVPWVARRQVMIPADTLPDPPERLRLFEVARALFVADDYQQIGIDHFARPNDGLAIAARQGRLRRNFQGYTDDQSDTLIGLGASSISRFPQGYTQNAPATQAYVTAIREGRFSVAKGHRFSAEDIWRARMIEALMCDFAISSAEFRGDHGLSVPQIEQIFHRIGNRFGTMVNIDANGLRVTDEGRPLVRMMARMIDAYDSAGAGHSSAI